MTIPLPNLDDRRFADLVEEACSLIPRYCPEWTNHNPSDPGITLIELLAWFSEAVLYRTNRIPEETYRRCLTLLMGSEYEKYANSPLDTAFKAAASFISTVERAVTLDDYGLLALRFMKERNYTGGRVVCRINRDFTKVDLSEIKPGHASVIVIPQGLNGTGNKYLDLNGLPTEDLKELIKNLKQDLDDVRVLTHRVHVVYPKFLKVTIKASLVLSDGADADTVKAAAIKQLISFCDPIAGGPDKCGWEVGRSLYRSELLELLEGIPGVDHTHSITLINIEKEKNNESKQSSLRNWTASQRKHKRLQLSVDNSGTVESSDTEFKVAINQFIEWSPSPIIEILEE